MKLIYCFTAYLMLMRIEGTVLVTLFDNLSNSLQIDLMLMGKKPNTAMRCLEQLQLFPVIFTSILINIKPPLEENIGR